MTAMITKEQRVERLKKIMDFIAYGSLGLDIMISMITVASMYHLGSFQNLLAPINLMLTAVVALTILLAMVIITLMHYEHIYIKMTDIHSRVRYGVERFRKSKYEYSMKKGLLEKITDRFF